MEDKSPGEPPKVGEFMRGRVPSRSYDDLPDPRSRPQQPAKSQADTPIPSAAAPRPATAAQPDAAALKAAAESKHLEGMRFLYDNDDEFKKAKRKLAHEIAVEKVRKEVARKARTDKFQKYRRAAQKALWKFASRAPGATYRFLHRYLPRLGRLMASHRRLTAAGFAGILVLVIALQYLPGTTGRSAKVSSVNPAAGQTPPEFAVLAPGGDAASTGSGKVAYDEVKKVASYTDRIADVTVTVSQQPLPAPFAADPDAELKRFAEQIYAKERIETGSATAYIGASIKGPQTIVLIKDKLLVFISTEKKVETPDIIRYISSLR